MTIEVLKEDFTVCKLEEGQPFDFESEFSFLSVTDDEISLVIPTDETPATTAVRENGWRGMRISGTLDFSLIGILAKISAILADKNIGIFVVSTYNTDYIFIKKENLQKAVEALQGEGYEILICL